MKRLFILICIMLSVSTFQVSAQKWTFDWNASSRIAGTTGEYMPFWARTGEDGILPLRSSGLLTAGADIVYNGQKGFFYEAGTNLVGALALKSPLNTTPVYGMVDRLYASAGWKILRVDVGLKPRRGDLDQLSISGGDIMLSGNARNLPGINVSSDWIYFEKGHWVGIKGNLAHYFLLDPRERDQSQLHNKAVAIKLALGHNVDLIAGFDHYAWWAGESQAFTFDDYVKIFFAGRGDSEDSRSEQLNVFGNHLGREWARVVWRAKSFSMTFQYDKPFEDNSGMRLKNCPDGVWTFQMALANRKAAVTDVTYELITTTWQSGSLHDRPATEEEMANQDPNSPWYGKIVLGGRDDYFNHSPYYSGWTHYGRTLGLPLMVPRLADNGASKGIINNRVRGHHLAVAGVIAQKVPYRFKSTYTENYGTYFMPFDTMRWQLSLALEADKAFRDMTLSLGVYGDIGQLYQNGAGLTLKLAYHGQRKW